MLNVAIIFTFSLIVFCNANNNIGDYQQIVLTQYNPLTTYLKTNFKWPSSEVKFKKLSTGARDALKNQLTWILGTFYPLNINDGIDDPMNCPNIVNKVNTVSIDGALQSRLSRQWPNFISQKNEMNFWKEAWVLYGTCMTDLESINNPNDYLQTAIETLESYNIGYMLALSRVESGNSLNLTVIEEKLDRLIRKKPILMCIPDEMSADKQYLSEASLCFDKTFLMESCPQLVSGYSYDSLCDYKKYIIIP